MIGIKYLLLLSFLCVSIFTNAQSKHIIKNVYATYTIHIPGNIPVGRNGKALARFDTVNIIYIETPSKEIRWNMAWQNDKTFSIITTMIDSSSLNVGVNKSTNENMVIRTKNGNKLWQLQLVPGEKKLPVHSPSLRGEILLEGIYHNKKITQKIYKQTELISIPSV